MRLLMKMDTGEFFPWTEYLAKRGDMVEAMPEEAPAEEEDAEAPKKRGRPKKDEF